MVRPATMAPAKELRSKAQASDRDRDTPHTSVVTTRADTMHAAPRYALTATSAVTYETKRAPVRSSTLRCAFHCAARPARCRHAPLSLRSTQPARSSGRSITGGSSPVATRATLTSGTASAACPSLLSASAFRRRISVNVRAGCGAVVHMTQPARYAWSEVRAPEHKPRDARNWTFERPTVPKRDKWFCYRAICV